MVETFLRLGVIVAYSLPIILLFYVGPTVRIGTSLQFGIDIFFNTTLNLRVKLYSFLANP